VGKNAEVRNAAGGSEKNLEKGIAMAGESANKAPAVVIRNWWTPQDNVGGSLKPGSREQASILVR
jgi:hypothetical protein